MASVYPLLSRQFAADREAAARTMHATARAFLTFGDAARGRRAGASRRSSRGSRAASEFAAADDPLRLLLCAAALAYVSGLCGYALIAAGHERSTLRLALVALAFNLALNIALAPAYGATASAAIALASEALLLAGGWLLRPPPARDAAVGSPGLGAVVLAAAVMVAAIWPLRDRTLALTVPLGGVVYGAALWALGGVDRRTLEALRG